MTAYCPAATLLDLATKHLIEKLEDANIRSDDPQGSMTRFGEGVVFVESLAAQFKVCSRYHVALHNPRGRM